MNVYIYVSIHTHNHTKENTYLMKNIYTKICIKFGCKHISYINTYANTYIYTYKHIRTWICEYTHTKNIRTHIGIQKNVPYIFIFPYIEEFLSMNICIYT